jgi:hypothetical protein
MNCKTLLEWFKLCAPLSTQVNDISVDSTRYLHIYSNIHTGEGVKAAAKQVIYG